MSNYDADTAIEWLQFIDSRWHEQIAVLLQHENAAIAILIVDCRVSRPRRFITNDTDRLYSINITLIARRRDAIDPAMTIRRFGISFRCDGNRRDERKRADAGEL